MYVVLVDRLDWEAVRRSGLPNWQRLAETGAIGVMNTNTAGRRIPEDGYATIAAGRWARGTEWAGQAFEPGETVEGGTAGDAYTRRTGQAAPDAGAVHLGAGAMRRGASRDGNPVPPGVLGDAFRVAGLRRAVLGNADVPGDVRRYAAIIAMDSAGAVDMGFIGRHALTPDPAAPFGVRTDWDALAAALERFEREARLLVVETGDYSRLDAYRPLMTPGQERRTERQILTGIDGFLGFLLARLDFDRDLLIVASPSPPAGMVEKGDSLAPLLMAGAGVRAGLVNSPSTRRPGLAANTDLAPTVLSFLGLPVPAGMVGRPLGSITAPAALERVIAFKHQALLIHEQRPILVKGYVFFQILLILAASLLILLARRGRMVRLPLVALMTVPAAMLLYPFFMPVHLAGGLLVAVGLTAAGTLVAITAARAYALAPVVVVSLGTVGLLLLEVAGGAPLSIFSPFSYSPVGGARYYGIGNEYMGVLIGATIVGSTALLDLLPHRRSLFQAFSLVLFGIVAFFLASPDLGANFGGTVSAAVAFGYVSLRHTRPRFTAREAAMLGGMVAAAVALVVLLNAAAPVGGETHIGRAAGPVMQADLSGLQETVKGKLALNLKLIRYTIWSRVFLVSLGTFVLLLYRPVGLFAAAARRYPHVSSGLQGVALGAVTALVANDSGVVAAATMLIFGSAPLLLLLQEETICS